MTNVYRDDVEALRAQNQTLAAELRAERKQRQAAEARAHAARMAHNETLLKLQRATGAGTGPGAGRRWYQSGFWAVGCLGLSAALTVMALRPERLELPGPPEPPLARPVTVVEAPPPRVPVELYMMSKCPYGVRALQGLTEAVQRLPERVDLRVDFIASDQNGQLSSMHGSGEVSGDILHLCVARHYSQAKYLAFAGCLFQHWRKLPEGWQDCADSVLLGTERLRTCYEGAEGRRLLRESLSRAQEAKAHGSPTFVIGGKPYTGGRAADDFVRAICGAMEGKKPGACAGLPRDVVVRAVVLEDRRCKENCNPGMEDSLRGRFFPKLEVRRLDYATSEGRRLYRQLGLKHLPAWLFEKEVRQAAKYPTLERWLSPRGRFLQLRMSSTFDPEAEICDNRIDDTGNGKIDCLDPGCADKLICRPERPGRLDLFMMSQCPFAAKAVIALEELMRGPLGREVQLDVHYIASERDGGFSALHGQPEVEENIRQLCAKKHYREGNRYLRYLACRARDPRSAEWKQCATGKISAERIEACAGGEEGRRLLAADLKLAQKLAITASPTWLANNRHTFAGIEGSAIRQQLCARNPQLRGCPRKSAGTVPKE